jgi:hypothetical protein
MKESGIKLNGEENEQASIIKLDEHNDKKISASTELCLYDR